MKKLIIVFLILFCCSCGHKLLRNELISNEPDGSIGITFINDSVCKVYNRNQVLPQSTDTITYKYKFLKKISYYTIKENQPVVNFKMTRIRSSFQQKIALQRLRGTNNAVPPFKEVDTLEYAKIKKKNTYFSTMVKRDLRYNKQRA